MCRRSGESLFIAWGRKRRASGFPNYSTTGDFNVWTGTPRVIEWSDRTITTIQRILQQIALHFDDEPHYSTIPIVSKVCDGLHAAVPKWKTQLLPSWYDGRTKLYELWNWRCTIRTDWWWQICFVHGVSQWCFHQCQEKFIHRMPHLQFIGDILFSWNHCISSRVHKKHV